MIEYTFPQSIVIFGFCVVFSIAIMAIAHLLGKYIDYLSVINDPEKNYIGPPYSKDSRHNPVK
jgi:hypothetical protein